MDPLKRNNGAKQVEVRLHAKHLTDVFETGFNCCYYRNESTFTQFDSYHDLGKQ